LVHVQPPKPAQSRHPLRHGNAVLLGQVLAHVEGILGGGEGNKAQKESPYAARSNPAKVKPGPIACLPNRTRPRREGFLLPSAGVPYETCPFPAW